MRFYCFLALLSFCLRMEAQDSELEEIKIDNYSTLTVGDLEKFILDEKDHLCACWLRDNSFECTCMPAHKFFIAMTLIVLPPVIGVGTWLYTNNCVTTQSLCLKGCDHIRYDNVWHACVNGCPDGGEWINPQACNTGIGLLSSVAPLTLMLRGTAGLCSWTIEKIMGTKNKKIVEQINKKFFHCRDENTAVSDDDIYQWGNVLMERRSILLRKLERGQILILCQRNFSLFKELINEGYFPDVKPLAEHLAKLTSMASAQFLEELNTNQIGGCPMDTKIWETLVQVVPRKNQNADVEEKLLNIVKNIITDVDNHNDLDCGAFIDQVIKCRTVDNALKKLAEARR